MGDYTTVSKTIRYKLYGEEVAAFQKFCRDVKAGLEGEELNYYTPERIAKQALFRTIQETYRIAREMQENQHGNASGNSDGDMVKEQIGSSSDSDALADTRDTMDGGRGDSQPSGEG